MSFSERLTDRYLQTKTLLCVGLDPTDEDLQLQSATGTASHNTVSSQLLDFVDRIVTATSEYALAYKANVAFFERWGLGGYLVLSSLRELIPAEIPLILDAKRGDIGSTARAYAIALFDQLGADAVTVSGYLGSEGVLPFAEKSERGVFVLCRTSNPSGAELQELKLEDGTEVYLQQAKLAKEWNTAGNIGLVVGATHSQELSLVRKECPDMWLLVPGIGAQGGDLEAVLRAGHTYFGGLLINVSRGISRAEDPGQAAEDYVQEMRETIRHLESV